MEYRFATVADMDMLVATRVEVLRAANKLDENADMSDVERASRTYYEQALESGEHVALLVYDGDCFAGAGGVSFFKVMPTVNNPSGRKAYIMNMYTRPEFRRRRVAWRTLDLLVQECRKRGVDCISLEATDMGRPLYTNMGFFQCIVKWNCRRNRIHKRKFCLQFVSVLL